MPPPPCSEHPGLGAGAGGGAAVLGAFLGESLEERFPQTPFRPFYTPPKSFGGETFLLGWCGAEAGDGWQLMGCPWPLAGCWGKAQQSARGPGGRKNRGLGEDFCGGVTREAKFPPWHQRNLARVAAGEFSGHPGPFGLFGVSGTEVTHLLHRSTRIKLGILQTAENLGGGEHRLLL